MAKTYKQIKNEIFGEKYDINSNLKKKSGKLSYAEIRENVKSGRYDFSAVKYSLADKIGFDTFESDASALSKSISDSYGGWQSADTMANTRSSIESMKERIKAYQDYRRLFGNDDMPDLSDFTKGYNSVLDEWDGLVEQYGKYDSADAYTNAMVQSKNAAKEYERMKNAYLPGVQKEIDDLEGLVNQGKNAIWLPEGDTYEQQMNARKRDRGYNTLTQEHQKDGEARDEFAKSHGYANFKDMEDALGKRQRYYNQTKWLQKGLEMAYVGDEESDSYDPEFGEKSKYNKPTGFRMVKSADSIYEFINEYRNADDDELLKWKANTDERTQAEIETAGYKYMTDQEVALYNYYYNTEGRKKAEEYLNTIVQDIGNRKATADFDRYKDSNVKEYLFGIEAGLDQFSTGMKNFSNMLTGNDEYIPVNATQQLSGMIRQDLYEDNGAVWGSGVYDLTTTTFNMLPSILTSTLVGFANPVAGQVVGAGLMGASASGNAYQEMLNLGYSNGQARTYATLVGVSEAGLQYALGGIGKLGGVSGKLATAVKGIDNALARFAIRFGGSVASEGLEEGLQEVLNPLFMDLAAGYDTGEEINWEEVAYSAILGGISGGLLGGGDVAINTANENIVNKGVGRNIKANERTADLFDLASISPEASSAYDTYTMLANKGINPENVSDYQLGLLASDMRADAEATINSKKFTEEQREQAKKTIADLDVYGQSNPSSKTGASSNFRKSKVDYSKYTEADVKSLINDSIDSSEEGSRLHTLATEYKAKVEKGETLTTKEIKNLADTQQVELLIQSGLESAEGTEAHKLATEYKAKVVSGKKLTDAEISKLEMANDMAIKSEEKSEVASRLTELGESEEVANIIARKSRGEAITKDEAEKLIESDVAMSVLAERSGTSAENIATEELLTTAQSMDKDKGALFVSLYDGKTDVEAYANHFNVVVAKAENGFGIDDILSHHRNVLSGKQIGKIFSEVRIKADHEQRLKFQKLVEKTANVKSYKAKIDDSIIDYNNTSAKGKINWNDSRITDRMRKAITFIKGFAQATGINLRLVADETMTKENGSFNITNNEITIDIFAGKSLDYAELLDTIIPTTSHELTHWMEKKSPVLYRKISALVFSTLQKHDRLTESERIANEIDRLLAEEYKRNYEAKNPDESITMDAAKEAVRRDKDLRNKAYKDSEYIETARSEIVARACEDMLSRSKVGKEIFNSLSETEQKTLVDKIKEIIQNLKDWVSDFLGLYKSSSYEASVMREYESELDKLSKLWDEMLTESVEVNQALEKSGEFNHNRDLANNIADANKLLFNERFIETHIDSIKENYSEESTLPLSELLSRYNKIIDIWKKLGAELDSDFLKDWNNKVGKDRTFTVFKKQQGYKYNVELSSMCKKGIPLFEAIDTIVKKEVMKELKSPIIGKAEKEILYDILKSHNFEIPCAICYVEQARQREGKVISDFLNGMVEKSATGKVLQFKLGWNDTLKRIQDEMHKNGVDYTFPSVDRNIATDKYTPSDLTMDEQTQEVFFNALKKIANEEIRRYNKDNNANKSLITKLDPESLKSVFKGKLPLNIKIFKTLINEPSSRFMIDEDLLYSSMTTQNLASSHNGLYTLFNEQGGVGGYKTKQGSVIYWGDILNKNWIPATVRNEGGVRNQSNSDFLMYTLLDHAQMYIDFTAKGYYLQAYTKVLSELKLFGLSKGKINASLIPKVLIYRNADGSIDVEKTKRYAGLDENGNPIYDDFEGINHEEAFMLLEDGEYSKSIGGVCIGYSDEHILKLLDDNRIQLIIGFHDKTDDPTKRYKGAVYSKNYNGINEATKLDSEGKLKTVHIGFNQFIRRAEGKFKTKDTIEYNGKTYTKNDIPKLAADLYLEHCESKGLNPAYSQKHIEGATDFSKHPNYYKLLADFSLYDINGNYAPHEKVEYNMPDQVPYLDEDGNKAYMFTEDYIRKELKSEIAVRNAISESLADKSEDGIIPQFIKKANELHEKNKILRQSRDSNNSSPAQEFNEYSVQSALWEAFDHADEGFDNLIKVSQMPKYFVNMFGIDGDFYIYRNHSYENMVSKEQAEMDGRPTRRYGKDVHFHNLGIETMTKAMMSLDTPSVVIADEMADGNPAVLMVLPVFDEDGAPLYGVVSFYSNRSINGDLSKKPHILLTIHKKEYFETDGRQGIVDVINEAIEENRIVDFDRKKMREDLPVIAQHTRLGNITENSLNESLSQFRKKVNSFREKNKITYQSRETTSVYDLLGESSRLKKENEQIKADIERLSEALAIEKKVTHGTVFNTNQINVAAGHIRNIAKSNIDKVELMKSLKGFYTFIAESSELAWEDVFARAYHIAEDVLAESKPEVIGDEYSSMILKDIKNTRISFTEAQKTEAQNRFGSNWNRYFFGKTTLTNDGISLESQWQEWAEMYPGTFDADIGEIEMVSALYDVLGDLKSATETVAEYDSVEQTRWLAMEIYNTFWNVSPVRTTADRYSKKIDELKSNHKKAMAEFRTEYSNRAKEKADRQKMLDDMFYGRKLLEKDKAKAKAVAEQRAKEKANIQKVKEQKELEFEKRKLADDMHFGGIIAELRRRREEDVSRAKERGREMLDKYKDNAERKTYISRITSNALSLNKMLITNSKDYHVHEALKAPVIKLLQALDFSSERRLDGGAATQKEIKLAEAFAAVNKMLVDANNFADGLEVLYGYDTGFLMELQANGAFNLVNRQVESGKQIINAMTVEELKALDKLFKELRSAISKFDQFHVAQHREGIRNLAESSMAEMSKLGGLKYQGSIKKTLSNLDWNNTTPYYAFRRYGESSMKIFEALMDGDDKIQFLAKDVEDFTEKLYTDKDIRKWEKKIYTFSIKQRDGNQVTFKMTLPQIMELYCSYKQEDAKKHFANGITIEQIDQDRIAEVNDNILLEWSDYDNIISKLDEHPEAKKVADSLHEYMIREGGRLLDEISLKRWGIKTAGIKNYYPLKISEGRTDSLGNSQNEKMSIQNELFALISASFTKNRVPGAGQSIQIGSIFDTFANHMASVITYNAMALPILDAMRWYNYRGTDTYGHEFGVSISMGSAFGKEGTRYFTQLIKDVNGVKKATTDGIYSTLLRNYKISAVGAKVKVALLQPTAYVKAFAMVDAKYLLRGISLTDIVTLKGAKEAQKYCGIALKKSKGYIDINIGRGLANDIKHQKSFVEKIRELSMKMAEYADNYTFGNLWNACELEIRDTRKDLKVGSEEFKYAVGKRMRDVVYATQVADSTLTRSQIMRSSDGKMKELTMFMSEPVLAYNMVTDAFLSYNLDKKRMGKDAAKQRHIGRIARVLTAYTVCNALTAVVETAWDAFNHKDDEDDEFAWWKEFFKNFALNMGMLGKIPFFKEFVSAAQGFDSVRVETQALKSFFDAFTYWKKTITGKPRNGSKAIKNSIRSISDVMGLPFYSVYQQLILTTTKLGLFSEEDLNEMFEDFLD